MHRAAAGGGARLHVDGVGRNDDVHVSGTGVGRLPDHHAGFRRSRGLRLRDDPRRERQTIGPRLIGKIELVGCAIDLPAPTFDGEGAEIIISAALNRRLADVRVRPVRRQISDRETGDCGVGKSRAGRSDQQSVTARRRGVGSGHGQTSRAKSIRSISN